MFKKISDWLLGDFRRRVQQLNNSLDVLEERYVSLRADAFRKRVARS